VETNTQLPQSTEKKSVATHDTETHSLLSVKQDFSRLDFTENSSELSCSRVLSECDEDAETAGTAHLLHDVTVDEASAVEPIELTSDHQVQSEHLQPNKSCDPLSNHHDNHEEPDEFCVSPSTNTDGNEFSNISSNHEETAGESNKISDAACKSKKISRKRKPAECTSSVNERRTSAVSKKLRHKTCAQKTPASQLVRTTSGTFVVHDITEPGEMLQSVSYRVT